MSIDLIRPPSPLLVEPQVRAALIEDLGRAGDITSDLTIARDAKGTVRLMARKPGVLAGLNAAEIAFRLIDPTLSIDVAIGDGGRLKPGDRIASISGSLRAILTAERVALNFAGHLSGVATATAALVDAVAGTRARIVCTRKTTPGLRVLEKYAVRCGGGFNHRFGLDDAVLIKDNHIAAAGGVAAVLERVRASLGHMTKVEIEVDTLAQLEEALSLGANAILLDNMSNDDLRRAVALTKGRATLEASGNVTAANVRAIAETGVDTISSGAITHSAANLDLGLDF